MRAEFICPVCRQAIAAPSSLQGEAYACPKCSAAVDCWPAPVSQPPLPVARPLPAPRASQVPVLRQGRKRQAHDPDDADDDDGGYRPWRWPFGAEFTAWLIVWACLSVVGVIAYWPTVGWRALFTRPLGAGVVLFVAAVIHYSRKPCPGCGSRWSGGRWDHPRIDGGPDRRFKYNAFRCCRCGAPR